MMPVAECSPNEASKSSISAWVTATRCDDLWRANIFNVGEAPWLHLLSKSSNRTPSGLLMENAWQAP
jgi:hypothetical protein